MGSPNPARPDPTRPTGRGRRRKPPDPTHELGPEPGSLRKLMGRVGTGGSRSIMGRVEPTRPPDPTRSASFYLTREQPGYHRLDQIDPWLMWGAICTKLYVLNCQVWEWKRSRRKKMSTVYPTKPPEKKKIEKKITLKKSLPPPWLLGFRIHSWLQKTPDYPTQETNWMIAFDRHIQLMEKEGMAGYEWICRFIFSSVRLEIWGKVRFFQVLTFF